MVAGPHPVQLDFILGNSQKAFCICSQVWWMFIADLVGNTVWGPNWGMVLRSRVVLWYGNSPQGHFKWGGSAPSKWWPHHWTRRMTFHKATGKSSTNSSRWCSVGSLVINNRHELCLTYVKRKLIGRLPKKLAGAKGRGKDQAQNRLLQTEPETSDSLAQVLQWKWLNFKRFFHLCFALPQKWQHRGTFQLDMLRDSVYLLALLIGIRWKNLQGPFWLL